MVSAAGWYAAGVEQPKIAKRSLGQNYASTASSLCKRQGHEPIEDGVTVAYSYSKNLQLRQFTSK